MRMTEEEYAALMHRKTIESYSASPEAKQSKYRNQRVTIDGISFDSKKEGERYRQLKMLERAGKVSNLALQPAFELAPAVSIAGKLKKPLRYVADFSYIKNGKIITEDVKGMKTDVYLIKKHLLKHIYGIDILET